MPNTRVTAYRSAPSSKVQKETIGSSQTTGWEQTGLGKIGNGAQGEGAAVAGCATSTPDRSGTVDSSAVTQASEGA